jgi:hypothetical protein
MVFKKGMLKNIFWSKREATGDWKKLHSEEPYGLYSSRNIIQEIK